MTERKMTILFEEFDINMFGAYYSKAITEDNYILVFNKNDYQLFDMDGYNFEAIYEILFDDFEQFYEPLIKEID